MESNNTGLMSKGVLERPIIDNVSIFLSENRTFTVTCLHFLRFRSKSKNIECVSVKIIVFKGLYIP